MKRPSPEIVRLLLPVMAFAALLISVFVLRPNAMSYTGLHLLFKLGLPIALATLAQMVNAGRTTSTRFGSTSSRALGLMICAFMTYATKQFRA